MQNLKNLIALLAVALCSVASGLAANDSNLKVTQTNTVVSATNYTRSIDLGNSDTAEFWRLAYVKGEIPALANNTNSATARTYTLQTSTNNSTFVDTTPLIQAQLAGIASTGTGATNYCLPIPPTTVYRYLRVRQGTVAAAGDDSTITNTWRLVVP